MKREYGSELIDEDAKSMLPALAETPDSEIDSSEIATGIETAIFMRLKSHGRGYQTLQNCIFCEPMILSEH